MAALVNKVLVLLLLCGGLLYTEASHDASHCKMADFPVQQDFDEVRFQGKWYEVSWIILPWIKPEWNYYDFINNYTQTDYGLAVLANGRWPFNATECATPTTPRLLRTTEPGKYIKEYKGENKVLQNSSHWIADTDYDNYALVIGCRELALNGTCVAPDGWLWTRCPRPRSSDIEHMVGRLPDFCLSKDMFYPCYHNTECRADISDSCTPEDLTGGGGQGVHAAPLTGLTLPILITTALLMNLH